MPEVPPVPRPGNLIDRVSQVFDATGPLAATLAGFEARPSQISLALAVASTIESGGTLVAEAGTGIGKTLAYLVPAVLAGTRVLVSTGTRTLQDQIFHKDVPGLSRALGRPIDAAYLKGRTNYLCRHRFGRLLEAQAGLQDTERQWMERIGEWAADTETGDCAEIEDLPDGLPLWTDLSATSEQCLGRDCPEFSTCFVTQARDRAAAADVVIVNHHLLCADAAVRQGEFGQVIPDSDVAIIDEAHQLEDVVTQHFGVTLTASRVDDLARDATRAAAVVPAEQGARAVSLARLASDTAHAARRLFDAVRLVLDVREAGDRTEVTRESAADLRVAGTALDEALRQLADGARAQSSIEDLAAIRARAEAVRADLNLLTTLDDTRYVRFAERRGRTVALRAAPIDAASIIRDVVLEDRHATVLTSATLAVDRSLEYALSRFGLPGARTLRLESEFDYRTQAVLYLPAGMPDPRTPGFNAAAADEIARLLDCTDGRAFVLFTAHAAMRDVHRRLAARVPWPLLLQGTAPRTALLRDFRATPHAVLLATASFWQGVDVAGDALSSVIIDRLPFASPADPIVAARLGAIAAAGGHPFNEYQVPLATLTLLQGVGRLIRTRRDRGVLAILDPRLTRMAYGQRFLASLPPAPTTSDLAVVERFLRSSDRRSNDR